MARIRTIKPEFPQSESMGRVRRDARLLFVMLWTIADDEGRARANSRMLASLLFPYDDDAPRLIHEWLFELEREHCIKLYSEDGNAYLQIEKWLSHQKIDHPSPSRLPAFVANTREDSRKLAPDLVPGPRTMDHDLGPRTEERACDARPPKRKTGIPENFPFQADIQAAVRFWTEQGRTDLCATVVMEAAQFRDRCVGDGVTALDWSAKWRTWYRNTMRFNKQQRSSGRKESQHEQRARIIAEDHASESQYREPPPDQSEDHRLGVVLPYLANDRR